MLIPCEECGHDISTKASACPHCGAPGTAKREGGILDRRLFGSTVALAIAWCMLLVAISMAANQTGSSKIQLLGGVYILIGTLAYRSRKRQKLELRQGSGLRTLLEIGAIVFVILHPRLVFTPAEHVRDPFIPIVIPLWVLLAYIVCAFRKRIKSPLPVPNKASPEQSVDRQDYDDLLRIAASYDISTSEMPLKQDLINLIREKKKEIADSIRSTDSATDKADEGHDTNKEIDDQSKV